MKIREIRFQEKNSHVIKELVAWSPSYDVAIEETVRGIIHQIYELGDVALLDYTRQFDRNDAENISELIISKETLAEAWETITDEERSALNLAKKRITIHAEKQKLSNWKLTEDDASYMGQKITPLDSVGLYVPGGTASYPSSVLMNAIPAKVAGVKRLVMVSPAMQGELNRLVLAAAFLCEVDEYYSIGGAQAIAALAYGTKTLAPVDKIVGPGNIYVATAKKQVFGKVAIDMIAGPSEIAIISDGSVDAQWLAADLFSQAEHDPNAQAILITHDQAHADAVVKAMQDLLPSMPRHEIIEQSLTQRGAIVLTQNIDESITVANLIAPEHLEIMTQDAQEHVESIRHAGAIFIGAHTCEALGDYIAGPNHVLPTSGTARFSSPLGVYDFQKRSSLVYCTADKADELAHSAAILAKSERLYAHALSATCRLKPDENSED